MEKTKPGKSSGETSMPIDMMMRSVAEVVEAAKAVCTR
jgi:hypothetical protein